MSRQATTEIRQAGSTIELLSWVLLWLGGRLPTLGSVLGLVGQIPATFPMFERLVIPTACVAMQNSASCLTSLRCRHEPSLEYGQKVIGQMHMQSRLSNKPMQADGRYAPDR